MDLFLFQNLLLRIPHYRVISHVLSTTHYRSHYHDCLSGVVRYMLGVFNKMLLFRKMVPFRLCLNGNGFNSLRKIRKSKKWKCSKYGLDCKV